MPMAGKNIAPKWAAVIVIMLCAAAVTACAQSKEADDIKGLYGNYVFEKQIYMNPLSSFTATGGYKEYYTLTEDSLVLTDDLTGKQQKIAGKYEKGGVDEKRFADGFFPGMDVPDISGYKDGRQYTFTDADGAVRYRLYLLDDQIWLACIHNDKANAEKSEYIWSIYKIARFDGEIPSKV